ncbi:DUF1294 domain-containing protein [Vibrio vulnificus]|uniref:DUF1294 domain-containing protein n=1 Tax=Vibrio vulnificus TaxID=672 RepID=UPI0005F25B45|nr:DUF1294 domain-containing protein [Vibrio vulnificus]EGQ8024440.1 DUF1294 domain-containing protein [Vibrio vulnificus]ELV8759497.1 DUF1294 domain-containing protein [Vibrio vulnificus]PUZ92168.1 DUF1294 domain-containing protein [Vibrio vulnificus]RZQ76014.1 DUF1294 domain-containing protein [Vibrio vulnificus]RZR01856.1 DUF1294 domain-containing protein [Vibrio vulnificus]
MSPAVLFSAVFLAFSSVLTYFLGGELFVIAIYLLMSFVTFVTYAIDKRAAVKGQWRTSENTLHLMSLFFGWPGALLAQQTLRHKSQKQPFKAILWVTIIMNIMLFSWTLTPSGLGMIQGFIG